MSRAAESTGDRNIVSRYLLDIRNTTRLEKDQELDLARRYREGQEDSLNQLIEANLGFVVKVASEYRNLGLPFEDLLNEGNVGLIEAARRYDSSRGNKFITYAIWWIRKSILRALSDHARVVRVPTYHLRRVREVQETAASLRKSLGRQPRQDEISQRLQRRPARPEKLLQFRPREISLDERVGDSDNITVGDRLVDSGARDPEETVLKDEATRMVEEALDHLTEQEREVINHRFGLAGTRPLVLKEIGEMMGISRERVRQIEVQAKGHLRKVLARRSMRSGIVERSSVRGGCGMLRPLR